MPTYEYGCPSCGRVFDKYYHHDQPHEAALCVCGHQAKRRWSSFNKCVEFPGFREGYSHALDRHIGSKHQLSEELKLCGQEYFESSGIGMNFVVKD
jgi:putative FmdB family regulatory protein